MIFLCFAAVLLAYVLGSINFAVIFANAFLKKDVRELGSGNAGTTNVMRTAGVVPGLLTFICDALKGFAACFAGKMIFDFVGKSVESAFLAPIYGAYICGIVCMIGHVFPLFFEFKGGKGVAVSVGIFAVCCPKAIILGLTVFAAVLLISKTVSLSSLIATVVVVTLSIVFYKETAAILPVILLSVSMGIIIFIKHKDNIKRLINKEEKRLTFGGKNSG